MGSKSDRNVLSKIKNTTNGHTGTYFQKNTVLMYLWLSLVFSRFSFCIAHQPTLSLGVFTKLLLVYVREKEACSFCVTLKLLNEFVARYPDSFLPPLYIHLPCVFLYLNSALTTLTLCMDIVVR